MEQRAIKKSKTIFYIMNNKHTENIPIIQKSGIYKTECEECKMIYVEEIGRTIECRMKEYSKGQNIITKNSLYARRFNKTRHKFTHPTKNYEIIEVENQIEERILRGELEIIIQRKKDENKLINTNINCKNDDIFYHILKIM